MTPQPDAALEKRIEGFLSTYRHDLRQLSQALEQAGISHYSSGCGTKSVTFDLFPAHAYVDEMLNMLSLVRDHKETLCGGFKDATIKGNYNPAHDFMLYLRRWQLFADQAMQREGSSKRGAIAGHTRLLMESLFARLSEGKAGAALKTTEFCKLMDAISSFLSQVAKIEKAKLAAIHKKTVQYGLAHTLAQIQGEVVNRQLAS